MVYSRQAGAETPLERIELGALLTGIVETYPQFSSAEVMLAGEIPAVSGNAAPLAQCFSNLFDNGIKFVAPGVRPQINVWAETTDSRVRVFVADNGIGIPPSQWDKIFGIFYRINQSHAGTGIGLSVVKKAVERMGGSISLRSEVGQGSTFCVELQRAQP